MPRFDSSQMLPLFQIISPNIRPTTLMEPENDSNQKHRKKSKRIDVPVHKPHYPEPGAHIQIHKAFRKNNPKTEDQSVQIPIDYDQDIDRQKINRKQVVKENEKLTNQLTAMQKALNKRESQVLKLKDKLAAMKNFNCELLNENNAVKSQYQDVLGGFEDVKAQLKAKANCSSCSHLQVIVKAVSSELDTSKRSNCELSEDLKMLKNVVYRLNVQLERYQSKLCPSNTQISNNNNLHFEVNAEALEAQNENIILQCEGPEAAQQHRDHLHTPISWGSVNSNTLAPLLNAYQDTISEKNDIIKNYESELGVFGAKLKNILNENELLHKKSIEETEILTKNIKELENNRQELKVIKEQNDLLIKKCALKHDKLQEICKVYDHKIECVKRDYEVLQEQYHKTRIELSVLQGKHQSLIDAHNTLESDKQNVMPLSVHTASVNECKRLFEELKMQYDAEKLKLLNQIKHLEQQISKLEAKTFNNEAEIRDLQNKVKGMEKNLKKTEHKLVETQNVLKHTEISRDTCKRQYDKALEFGKKLVNEQESLLKQLSSQHKENKIVKEYDTQIVNRMDVLRSQFKTVKKDAFEQLSTVKERIQEQDSSMESIRQVHENEIEHLQKQIRKKEEYIMKLEEQQLSSLSPAAPYLLYREKHVHLS